MNSWFNTPLLLALLALACVVYGLFRRWRSGPKPKEKPITAWRLDEEDSFDTFNADNSTLTNNRMDRDKEVNHA